ncbi:glycine receptor subunit alpha-2-like [Haliotis rubra]|uniref:glycine receptor subunit alpha-2-like n=1 Tax=Haliotis rubra TaxID=36100 RepID=UPI001EE4F0E4|nr:glycine receptor subunit alpha-2-like [Haliotis rubra]
MMGKIWLPPPIFLGSFLCWLVLSHSLQYDAPLDQHTAISQREEAIRKILATYDANVPPNFEEDIATRVTVQIYIVSFDSISESTMDYSLTIFLRQTWQDTRLRYGSLPNIDALELDTRIMSQVWVPDLFFTNEKRADFHSITVPNKLMHVYPNGTVLYSARISMTLSCDMQLQKYPFDDQVCSILLESYSYSTKNVIFAWHDNPIVKRSDLSLPQFDLIGWTTDDCTKTYVSGNYTCIRGDFQLSRNFGYYIAQVYVPSILIVILSWMSFWLDIDATPARISLGLLTVLTMTTQSSGARASLPRVSYVKAIDVWMAMCLIFVFAALLEFAYVNVMARVERRRQTISGNSRPSVSGEELALELEKQNGARGRGRRGLSKVSMMRQKARLMDKISRYLFPGVFLAFNIIYWMVYMLWENSNTD